MEGTLVLTTEELSDLKSIQEQGNQIMTGFGQVEIAIQTLELQKESLIEALAELKQKETQYGQTLQDKYGNGNINIETGEFTPVINK
jgi:hypothetical protein